MDRPKTKRGNALESSTLEFRRKILELGSILCAIVVTAGGIARNLAAPLTGMGQLTLVFVVLGMIGTFIIARRSNSVQLAGLLFLFVQMVLIVRGGIENGGINAPVVSILVLFPVMGYFFGGASLGLFCLVVASLTPIGFFVVEKLGWIAPFDAVRANPAKVVVLFFLPVFSYILGWSHDRARRMNLQHVVGVSKLASLGTLASGIAHEINGPLSIIYGKIDQLMLLAEKNRIEKEKLMAELVIINSGAERVAAIVRNLQHFAREGNNPVMGPARLDNIVQEIVGLMKTKFANRGVNLKINLDASAMVFCVPSQIGQVVLSLLSNAYDATQGKPDAWVELVTQREGGNVVLQVTDSGGPIPQGIAEQMMEPFFSTKQGALGMGLSLSLCLVIAEDHMGSLIHDQTCPHTRFVFKLPLYGSTLNPLEARA